MAKTLTMAEVRERIEEAERDGRAATSDFMSGYLAGEARALRAIALPLAEERDAEGVRAVAAEAEVARLKAQLASTEESIRLMENAATRDDREGGHGCGCGGY